MVRNLLFILLLSFSAAAQEETKLLAPFQSRWQIGVGFSPDIAYRTLSGSSSMDWIIDMRDDTEDPIFGYTTGAAIVFNLNNHLGIESGAYFSEKGYGFHVIYTTVEAENAGEGVSRTVLDYVELPLKVNYTIGKNKLRWTASAGIINGILVDARQVSKYTIEGEGSGKNEYNITSEFRDYNLSATVSAGIDWGLSSRMHLKAAPVFRYGLTDITDSPITARLWSVGMNVGFYYGL